MIEKSTLRILLLDDEAFMLKLLNRILFNLGYTSVTACDTGQCALELISDPAGMPDLILCDLNMPEMDGIEFVRHLVDLSYTGSIILVSGEDARVLKSADKLVRAHKITNLGHLQKPVRPEAISALLDRWTPPLASDARSTHKVYSASEVRAAIINGELVNYYQPKVVVATGKVVGVEALVRWRHPVDGMVFPDQFIGVAEANALIDDLTRTVLKEAMAQSRVWRDAGLELRVAINISMDNLASLGFADYVAEQTAAFGIPTRDIVLEVTESRLMDDPRAPIEILTRLRLKRFHLSIDDFGTGHSSLAQLRDIPFDELKIDQSFVHRAWSDRTVRVMFNASLGLAQQLEMEAVAEGVEDQADWDFLRKTECHLAQGYFIARPMPGADIAAWKESWEARMCEGNIAPT